MNFQRVLEKYRAFSFSERDKGARFERLIQAYLKTAPVYGWNPEAENVIHRQNPPVQVIGLADLENDQVDWEELDKGISGAAARTAKKKLREHQQHALENFHEHFKTGDRGKLIMACGTGKTFTALKIAERETPDNGLVLFLVPSIALLSQTLREWTDDSSGSNGEDREDDSASPGDGKPKSKPIFLPLLEIQKIQDAFYARMVQNVGQKRYWEQWASDVAQIAQSYIERINRLIAREGVHKAAFDDFLAGIRKNINPSVEPDEVIEMLAQHLITRPVFEALFENYSFVKNNPVSQSLQGMIDLLEEQALEKDTIVLSRFYESVKRSVSGIETAEGRQKIIVELYEKFFKTAFPKTVEKLGIVYTPVEIVDFINHSVAAVLEKEFGRKLSDENVHILDPFTGTGTFIARMIQSGLIDRDALPRKYEHELHANEIVLLAYYIASINIESEYHDSITNYELRITDAAADDYHSAIAAEHRLEYDNAGVGATTCGRPCLNNDRYNGHIPTGGNGRRESFIHAKAPAELGTCRGTAKSADPRDNRQSAVFRRAAFGK